MQLRRFSAKNVSEVLKKVKAELGDEAIILSTKNRSVKDRVSGRTIDFVEVVAAADKQHDDKSIDLKGIGRDIGRGNPISNLPNEALVKEIEELKSEIRKLASFVKAIPANALRNEDITKKVRPGISRGLQEGISSCLGLDKRSEEMVAKILSGMNSNKGLDWREVINRLSKFIRHGIRKGDTAEDLKGRCWWAFVGPTGVGKTTTLAKIAARLKFLCKRDGVLICVDGYRLGAKEQLARYANLMDIPMEIARTNKDLLKLFAHYKEKDFIFVDTTGRNPFSSVHKMELQRLFDSVPGLMAQVMLSATSKREDLMGAISFYKQFPLAGWSLSKIDETRSLASSVFSVIEAELPLSYVTNGQRVPEDIKFVNPIEIAQTALEPLKGLERLFGVPSHADDINSKVVPETL